MLSHRRVRKLLKNTSRCYTWGAKLGNLLALDHACNNVDLRSSPRWSVFFNLRATKTNKLLNNCMHASTRTRSRIYIRYRSSSKKLRWYQGRKQKYFGPADYFMAILRHIVYYTFIIVIPSCKSVHWLNAYCSLRLFTTYTCFCSMQLIFEAWNDLDVYYALLN